LARNPKTRFCLLFKLRLLGLLAELLIIYLFFDVLFINTIYFLCFFSGQISIVVD
jgi:hypothetical protein